MIKSADRNTTIKSWQKADPEKRWVIYILMNPQTKEVKYVGYTAQDLIKRYKQHIAESRRKPKSSDKCKWVVSLDMVNCAPLVQVIEYGSGSRWRSAEKWWIAYFKENGAILTNSDAGGRGGKMSAETKKHLSESAKRRWENMLPEEKVATVARLQAACNPESRSEGLRVYHASLTPEQRSQRAKDIASRKSPEMLRAPGIASMAKLTPEQRSAKSKHAIMTLSAEQRSEVARNAAIALRDNTTAEQKTLKGKKGWETIRARNKEQVEVTV